MTRAALTPACFHHSLSLLEVSECYGELTAAYGQSEDTGLTVESGSVRDSMQTFKRAATVIFVSTRSPEATVAQDIEAAGVVMQWAPSIAAADGLLNSARERTVIVTELALADGNWRDLVERVRSRDVPIPIVLLTSASTAELWWDALECGIDDILPRPLTACPLCQFLKTHFTS